MLSLTVTDRLPVKESKLYRKYSTGESNIHKDHCRIIARGTLPIVSHRDELKDLKIINANIVKTLLQTQLHSQLLRGFSLAVLCHRAAVLKLS